MVIFFNSKKSVDWSLNISYYKSYLVVVENSRQKRLWKKLETPQSEKKIKLNKICG